MNLKLSKIEIIALRKLCMKSYSAGELAQELHVKRSFVSRLAKKLEGKGLVQVRKEGASRIMGLSPASHAQNFKKLSDSRPDAKIKKWLSGAAIGILVACAEEVEMGLLVEEAGCSKATLYKNLKALSGAGVIKRKKGNVSISDNLVKSFAISYADNMQIILQREVKGFNTSIMVRKHVVLRTDAKEVPEFLSETGLSALAKRGMEANVTSYRDFYFNLEKETRKIETEEMFIHALLLATLKQHADMPVIWVFYAKNRGKLKMKKLIHYANVYNVESELNEVRGKAEFHERMRDFE